MIDNLLFAHVDKEYVQDTLIEPNPDEGGTTPPTEPETPTEPDNPTEPETPTDPDTPTEPETPDTPPTVTDADGKGDFYLSSNSGKRWDYDTLTEIPSDMKNYSGTTGSYSISDGSLLLDDGDAEESAMAIKYYISAPASYNAAVLEFDFKLTQSYGFYPLQIKLGGATETIYYSNTYDASYGTGHKLCMKIGEKYVPLGITMNDWATVRFEHYFSEAVLKVYVNNKFVYDVPTSAGKADTATIYLTGNERKTGSDANLYIDNVYSAYLTLDYFEGAPEGGEEEPKDDAKGEYYLSGETGRRLDYDTITEIDASMKTYSGTVGSYSIVDGSLLIDDGDAESADIGMKFWLSYSTDFNNAANRCEILEFDFKLTKSYGSYPIQVKMAGVTYTLYYAKPTDTSLGTGYMLCMLIDGAYVPLGCAINKWNTIRFEHYYDAKKLKVFVDNEFVFDIATKAGSTGDSPRITLTSNERKTGSNADLYLDNIYVGHVLKDFVAGDPKAD
jgi:hypothetical protein